MRSFRLMVFSQVYFSLFSKSFKTVSFLFAFSTRQ